jgi:acyl-coenzyme A synthetase/AMP-(fatty) acid ligase
MASPSRGQSLSDDRFTVPIQELRDGSCFGAFQTERLRGCSVLLATTAQLPTALAAIELDGIARRILLCTPDLAPHLPAIVAEGQVDAIVTDDPHLKLASFGFPLINCDGTFVPTGHLNLERSIETQWVLFTSGTTGRPKMVAHTLSSLTGPLDDGVAVATDAVWSTFYDIRRYGGLQILLRALIGGGSMVLSNAEEAVGDFLARLATAGVTHLSGTPSHWRRALMSSTAASISPTYVRISGEVADQNILNRLRRAYPASNIAHAFASTEAGVAFDVRDGLAGFPASFLSDPNHPQVELRVEDHTLRIRSSRTALGYLGQQLHAPGGFVDTGDLVEKRGDRYYFIGRAEGVINVGGQKVYPEEVEDLIAQHPDVQVARVWPRKNPIMGAVVAADVVIQPKPNYPFSTIRGDLIKACRAALPAHKVPVTVRQVDSIEMTAAGKVRRA